MTLDEIRNVLAEGLAGVRSAADMLATYTPPQAPIAPVAPPQAGPRAFFNVVRLSGLFDGGLTQEQVDGCNAIMAASEGAPVSWRAYCLATAYHETGGEMQPVEEIGKGRGKPYGKPGRNGGQAPYGRGHVQLTHDENYERADKELGLRGALIADYGKALDPEISARVLVGGMTGGWFTGKRLRDYLPEIATAAQFTAARRIVNGTDRAAMIAGYAMAFEVALLAAERPEKYG